MIAPVKDYSAPGTYVVTLGITDGSWQTARERVSVTVSAPTISLTATGAKVNSIQQVTLGWSGATGTSVQVRRTGTTSATFNTPNDGVQVDNLNRTGTATYQYQVCETSTSRCSAQVAVVFN